MAYQVYYIPKGNGKFRIITAPDEETKRNQKRILERLEGLYIAPSCVYGFSKGSSIFDNARPHIGQEAVLNIDLKDFFPQIKEEQVKQALVEYGLHAEVVDDLICDICRWCFYKGALPQGSPSSPILSNLYMAKLDQALMRFAKNHRLTYTRYADDLTFSGPRAIIYSKVKEIKQIVKQYGVTINEQKVQIQAGNKRKEVTGIIVNTKENVSQAKANRLRAILYNLEKKIDDQKIRSFVDIQKETGFSFNQLQGQVNFIATVNPRFDKYKEQIKRIRKKLV